MVLVVAVQGLPFEILNLMSAVYFSWMWCCSKKMYWWNWK